MISFSFFNPKQLGCHHISKKEEEEEEEEEEEKKKRILDLQYLALLTATSASAPSVIITKPSLACLALFIPD